MSAEEASASARLRAVLMVALAAGSWGCWSLFLRPSGLSAWETAPILFLVMGVTLLPFGRVGGVTVRWGRRTALLLLGNVAFDSINVVTFFAALGVTSVGVAVLTHYFAPLLVALAAPLVDRERVRGAIPAAFVATAGLALVLQPWTAPPRGLWLGAGLGLASAFAYAGNVFVLRRLTGRIGAVRTVSWHSLLAFVLLAPFADLSAIAGAAWGSVAWLVAGAIVLGALSGLLFLRGLSVIGSTRTTMLAFMEPLVAVIVGWIAWHERLAPPAFLGGALILGASAFVSLAPRRDAAAATGDAGIAPTA